MSDTVEVGGFQYRIGKIDARKQFHVARRLAPLLAGMSNVPDKSQGFAAFLGPLTDALSGMSDQDVDYVLDICLGACKRIQPSGHPAPVMVRGGLMFEDIDMGQMIQLAVKVIQVNLGGFFPDAAAA
jgi:hypothetical protein